MVSREPYAYRTDARVPPFDDAAPIVIFDGACVMCSGFVTFLLRHDRRRRLRFLSAQSELGQALYGFFGLRGADYDTYILLENGRARVKSDAAMRLFELLGAPFAFVAAARVVPRPLRDIIYDWVARNRLRWFGVRDACYAPTPNDADRFIQ